jgi:tRNA(Arg) A34 adenosine deaminase TadA
MLSRREEAWLNRAVELAKRSTERHQHACLIVRGGSVQAFGINSNRNIPGNVEDVEQLALHAEENALKACNRTVGAVAYIARVSKGNPRQSRPCPRCMQALKKAGIKRVIYTINGSEYL